MGATGSEGSPVFGFFSSRTLRPGCRASTGCCGPQTGPPSWPRCSPSRDASRTERARKAPGKSPPKPPPPHPQLFSPKKSQQPCQVLWNTPTPIFFRFVCGRVFLLTFGLTHVFVEIWESTLGNVSHVAFENRKFIEQQPGVLAVEFLLFLLASGPLGFCRACKTPID